MLATTRWKALALAVPVLLAALGGAWKLGWIHGPRPTLDEVRQLLAAGDTETAVVALKSTLQDDPQHADARTLMGQALLGRDDHAGAELELRRALDAGAPHDQVLPLLAEALMGQGKASQVPSLLAGARGRSAASSADLLAALAEARLRLGETDAAMTSAREALQADPSNVQARVVGARMLLAGPKPGEAAPLVDKLLADRPADWRVWLLRGDQLQRMNGLDEAAAKAYAKAAELRPTLVAAHGAVILRALAQGKTGPAREQWQAMKKAAPQHPQTLYHEALLTLREGKLVRANEAMQLLLRAQPDNFRFLLVAGEVKLRQNAFAQAETHLARALTLQPQDKVPRRLLAQAQMRAGQFERASATLKPLLAGASPEAEDLVLAGQLQMMSGSVQGAEALLARALASQPDNARAKVLQALNRLGRGWDEQAYKTLSAQARELPGAGLSTSLLNTLLAIGRVDEAGVVLDDLARRYPDMAMVPLVRGRIALMKRQPEEARRHFEAVLEKDPANVVAAEGLAAIDLAAGRIEPATRRYEALLDSAPRNAAALLALGDIRMAQREREAAVDLYRRAVDAASANAQARQRLIDAYLLLDQPDRALSAAESAVAALPDQPMLLQRLARVQLQLQRHQQAAVSFGKWAQLEPRALDARVGQALAHFAAGQPSAGIDVVLKGVEGQAERRQVIDRLLPALVSRKLQEPARALVRAIQAREPASGLGPVLEGDLALATGDAAGALAAYRRAMGTAAGSAAAVRAHNALLAAGKAADAEALARQWRKDRPQDALFNRHLGDRAMMRGAFPEAEALYRQVLVNQPRDVLALNNLAYVLVRQKKPGALDLARTAQRLAPDQAPVLDTLALALAEAGQWDAARAAQAQAVLLAPDAPDYRLALARYQWEAKDRAGSERELQTLARMTLSERQRAELDALRHAAR